MKYEVKQTSTFKAWLKKLKDRQALKIIALRLTRAVNGNLGDVKSLSGNLSEMRFLLVKAIVCTSLLKMNKLLFCFAVVINRVKAETLEKLKSC